MMFRHITNEVVLYFKYASKQLSHNNLSLWLLVAFFVCSCQKTRSGPRRAGLDTLYPSANTVISHHNNEWSRNNYIVRINSFRNNPLKSGEIVFIGNSLTEQGGDWGVKFGLNGIRNRGIAGDVTDGVLMRLQEIIYYKPKAVFLLIGVNDIYNLQAGGGITSADYIANNILKITKKIKAGSPATRIYVQTILPATAEIQMNTQLINTLIKRNGEAGIYTTIDLHAAFTNSQGLMRQDLTTDGLHLNDRGYKVWVDVVAPFVRQ